MTWIALGVAVGGLAIGGAIGFDDLELSPYQLDLLKTLGSTLGGLAVLGGGARYLTERQRELAWNKTRFIIELFQVFDDDDDYRRARLLIDHAVDSGDEVYLEKLTGPLSAPVGRNSTWVRACDQRGYRCGVSEVLSAMTMGRTRSAEIHPVARPSHRPEPWDQTLGSRVSGPPVPLVPKRRALADQV